MKKVLTDEDLRERSAIDGRVAFAVSAFALAALLVALLDRVGVPESIVSVLGPVLALAGLGCLGILMRSMRISRFYAAGRAVPSTYAGLALACLAAGLFAPFVPPVPGGTSLTGLLWGFGSGLAITALVSGPFLRKTGAFSLTDLLAARFPTLALRLGLVVVVVAIAGLIAVAGVETAVERLSATLNSGRPVALLLACIVLALILLPGGTGGVVWSATGAAGLLIIGFALPLILMIINGTPLPAPILGDSSGWREAVVRMQSWHDADATIEPLARIVILAIALGVGVLAPLLSPAIACRKRGTAQRAGLSALAWAAGIVLLVATTMAVSTLALETALEGLRPDRLPAFVYQASHGGLISICNHLVDGPASARVACASIVGFPGTLRPGDFAASGTFLMLGVPALRGFGTALSGLVAAGTIAASLVLAASAIQCVGVALAHDAFYRVRDRGALTSRRLAATRTILLVTIALIASLLASRDVDERAMVGLAIAFSAAAIAPLLALTLWPRASGVDATVALLTSLATAEVIITVGSLKPSIEILATAAVVGCVCGLIAGIVTSLLRAPDPMGQGGIFVDRVLHGASDVLNPDKGA